MKTYTRESIAPIDIEMYMRCPTLHKLADKSGSVSLEEIFYSCVEETIMHMYMIELSSGHKAELVSVKSFWDKTFWKRFPSDEAVLASKYYEDGLDIAIRYYQDIYVVCNTPVVAVKVPHELLFNNGKVGVPVTLEVVLVDNDNREVYLLLFTAQKRYSKISEDMASSIGNMLKMLAIRNETPSGYKTKATMLYLPDISIGHTTEITSRKEAKFLATIKYLVAGIKEGIVYKSRTEACNTCEFKEACKI